MPFRAYQLLGLRAQLAERLGQGRVKELRSRAAGMVEQIAATIADAALEQGFRRVAEGSLAALGRRH